MQFIFTLLQLYAGKAVAFWLVGQWASFHFEHSRCELALRWLSLPCCVLGQDT